MLFLALHDAVIARAAPTQAEPGIHSLWEWIEDHGVIVYPAILLVTIVLIASAAVAAWRAEEMGAEQKAEIKAQIMSLLRRRSSGVTVEMVAAELQIDLVSADGVLREMVDDRMIIAIDREDIALYRIRSTL